MLELGLRYGDGPVLMRELADSQQVSADYLEQLMGPLRRAGLIRTVRGARGGYQLAKVPDHITVKEIVDALEGRQSPADLANNSDKNAPPRWQHSAAHDLWREMEEAANDVLRRTSLGELCRRQREKDKQRAPQYAI